MPMLPVRKYNQDAPALGEEHLIPQKVQNALFPEQYGLDLNDESKQFLALVQQGFITPDVDGWETMAYWRGVGKPARLAAGLTDFQAFLDSWGKPPAVISGPPGSVTIKGNLETQSNVTVQGVHVQPPVSSATDALRALVAQADAILDDFEKGGSFAAMQAWAVMGVYWLVKQELAKAEKP